MKLTKNKIFKILKTNNQSYKNNKKNKKCTRFTSNNKFKKYNINNKSIKNIKKHKKKLKNYNKIKKYYGGANGDEQLDKQEAIKQVILQATEIAAQQATEAAAEQAAAQ